MNTFISYNSYIKNVTLNETYESFVELKILAKEIDNAYTRQFVIKNGRGSLHADMKKHKLYSISKIAKYDYKVIKDFINAKVGIIYTDDIFRSKETKAMYLSPAEDYKNYEILLEKFKMQYLIKNFTDGIIAIKIGELDKSVIIHELQHAYDDFRAKGKILHTKLGRKLQSQNALLQKMKSSKKAEDYLSNTYIKTYYRTPHEISSYFVQTLNDMYFFMDEDEMYLRDFNDVYEEFKEKFQGYRYLTPKDKKILARKFTQYYYKLKDRNIYDE